jgi:molecular chaperone DnaK
LKKTLEETASADVTDEFAQNRVKDAVEKLATASQALGAAMYESAQQTQADAPQDDVIDAEVVDESTKA